MTPLPSPVPAGVPQPWEGSVKGGGGSGGTEPSVFLSCVGGWDPVCASGSPALPLRQLPSLTARATAGLGHSAAPTGAAGHSGKDEQVCAREPVPDEHPELGSMQEGLCCGAEPVGQRLCGAHAMRGAGRRHHGTHSTHTLVRCPQTLPSPPCRVCLNGFVFEQSCPRAALQGPSWGPTSSAGHRAVGQVAATRLAGTRMSGAGGSRV